LSRFFDRRDLTEELKTHDQAIEVKPNTRAIAAGAVVYRYRLKLFFGCATFVLGQGHVIEHDPLG
jgi:hypothetical protein